MATLEQLEKALVNAHNAGDTDAARRFAGEIKRMRAVSAPPPPIEAEDPGALQAGVIGAGRMLDRVLIKGPKRLGLDAAAAFGHQGSKDELGRMEQEEAGNARAYE